MFVTFNNKNEKAGKKQSMACFEYEKIEIFSGRPRFSWKRDRQGDHKL